MVVPGIAVPGTVVPSGSLTSPGGAQGAQGLSADALAIGAIIKWPTTTAPVGWMICDGSAISRATYPDLFNLIGTTFGAGDGSTTFNLPDLRGRVGVGAGQGVSLTNRVLAAKGGEETHLLSTAEIPAHTHVLSIGFRSASVTANTTFPESADSTVTAGIGGATQANTGGGSAHNTMPPFLVLAFIIKVAMGGGPTAQAPIADTTQSGLLRQVSGQTTDFVDGTNNCHDLATAVRAFSPVVRSYNSIGNPNFEVDARTVGAGAAVAGWAQDRWYYQQSGTNHGTWVQNNAPGGVLLAGTCVSSKFLRYTLTTQESTLAAGDYIAILQYVEGVRLRELIGGPTTISILCRSSVANTIFGCVIQDNAAAYSLGKLCTVANANVWTWITLPNIATWTPSGSFGITPGVAGYYFWITLACGTTYLPPANDVWNAGNFIGAKGQGNFAANPVNSTFDLAYIGHEPGSTPSGIIDLDFPTNLQLSQRYYQRSGPYNVAFPSGNWEVIGMQIPSNTQFRGLVRFSPRMAKAPTMTFCDHTGVVGQIFVEGSGQVNSVSSYTANDGMLRTVTCGGTPTALNLGAQILAGYTADTGW